MTWTIERDYTPARATAEKLAQITWGFTLAERLRLLRHRCQQPPPGTNMPTKMVLASRPQAQLGRGRRGDSAASWNDAKSRKVTGRYFDHQLVALGLTPALMTLLFSSDSGS